MDLTRLMLEPPDNLPFSGRQNGSQQSSGHPGKSDLNSGFFRLLITAIISFEGNFRLLEAFFRLTSRLLFLQRLESCEG